MLNNQISPFEYVSILVSIILGLGITQLLSSFSDLLFSFKKTKFYWPHTLWILFVLFLHIQDWFITYQLKDKAVWHLPELFFILLYPIALFCAAKMLLPANENEERFNMKLFYQNQFPIIFIIIGSSVLISILFNVFFLKKAVLQQGLLILFLLIIVYSSIKKVTYELLHQAIAITITVASLISVIAEENIWIIK